MENANSHVQKFIQILVHLYLFLLLILGQFASPPFFLALLLSLAMLCLQDIHLTDPNPVKDGLSGWVLAIEVLLEFIFRDCFFVDVLFIEEVVHEVHNDEGAGKRVNGLLVYLRELDVVLDSVWSFFHWIINTMIRVLINRSRKYEKIIRNDQTIKYRQFTSQKQPNTFQRVLMMMVLSIFL